MMEAFRDPSICLVSGTESLLPDEAKDRSGAQSGFENEMFSTGGCYACLPGESTVLRRGRRRGGARGWQKMPVFRQNSKSAAFQLNRN
jgi:hypothetical protein